MIRSQQSEDENQGFFKPQQKVVQFRQTRYSHVEKDGNSQQANDIVNHSRPKDYNARIITFFEKFDRYQDFLMQNNCQQQQEQLMPLSTNKEKLSKKYLSLQQKYNNNEKFQQIYSKYNNPKQYGSYIFSLQNLTDYNDKNYIKAEQPEENIDFPVLIQAQYKFNSNFQSGNLLYAYRNIQEKQIPTFDLIIQNDTNTKGYNQWFYFSVQKNYKICQRKSIKINIVNFIKKHLMFEDGVRPVAMFQSQKQWKFIGRQTQYKKSYIKRCIQFNGSNLTKNYYTLSFLLDFPQNISSQTQKVYIALNYPYPYCKMISFVDKIVQKAANPSIIIQKQTLCYSISNNQVPYLFITHNPTQNEIQHYIKTKQIQRQKQKQKRIKQYPENSMQEVKEDYIQFTQQEIVRQILQKKKKIICIGRQHPGESVGSFVLEGFLDSLINGVNQQLNFLNVQKEHGFDSSNNKNSKEYNLKLLKQYSIYVFPMINVDGVIYGNFRTNLAGFDLNRQWIDPNKWLHPEVFYLKKFVDSLKNIQFVLDFHGHSRKLNSFIYACNNPVPILLENQEQTNYPNINIFRLYPYIFSKQCEIFSIKDCTYTISRDKVKTARINTFKKLNYNPYIFTLQTGFFGYNKGDKKLRYKIQDFSKIGKGALQSLKTVLLKPKKVKETLKQVQMKGYIFDMWSYENKEDLGSESNPSQDQLNPVQIKTKVLSDQKMRQKQSKQIQNQITKREQSPLKKVKPKKQKKRRQFKKSQTELKSQRSIIKNKQQSIYSWQEKISKNSQILKSTEVLKDKKPKSGKQQVNKIPKVQYLVEKKKNNEELFSVVMLKQAKVQKPQPNLILPNYRERSNVLTKKMPAVQQFKSSSNLLGTGTAYFQNKNSKIFQYPLKTGPATLQILEARKDVKIQSFSSGLIYEQGNNVTAKLNTNSFSRQNQIKDFFYNLNRTNQKQVYSKPSHRQRVYVVRQNKIVKIVNNVNNVNKTSISSKAKSLSQKAILQNQLRQRQQNLKHCQQIMSADNKGLVDEIKDQIFEQKKRKRKVYLHPLEYSLRIQ